jgi:pyridoxamine 5'-phosphate oxidase
MHSPIDFSTPAAGFDQPIEMWLACHQRVLRFAGLIKRLAVHVAAHGANEEAQVTATSIRRYFNEAAPRHHDDEELDLFPVLRERSSGTEEAEALAATDHVEDDHLVMAGLWRSLDAALAAIAGGQSIVLDAQQCDRFESLYRRHIEVEEQIILPALKRRLKADDWSAIGRTMAERRGLDWNELAAR